MFDHLSISVNNYEKSVKFYDETLKILGYDRVTSFEVGPKKVAGYGSNGKPSFWIGFTTNPNESECIGKARGFHIAFATNDIGKIIDWHQKCLELGGVDNGAPGARPEYHPGYYAAFIIDPNGWRLEAVMHSYSQ